MNQNNNRGPVKPRMTKKDVMIRAADKKKREKKEKSPEKEVTVKERSLLRKILSGIAITLLTIFLIMFITGMIVAGAFAYYIKNYIDPVIDDFDTISTDQKLSSKMYYMDYTDRENRVGTAIEIDNETLHGSENRIWVNFTEMPPYLYEAFISIEDERFWTHNGVDWKRK